MDKVLVRNALQGMICATDDDSTPIIRRLARVQARAALANLDAEAASGAGEREDALEAAARAMCDRVNGIGDYDENIGQRRTGLLAQAKAGIAAYLASLPPATDPAIPDGWKLVPVKPTDEMMKAAIVAWLHARSGVRLASEHAFWSAALAAAPTIPATGDVVPVIDAKMLGEVMQDAWSEICVDAGAHPLDMKHGRGSVLFYSPGHWTDLIALRLNERLSASGHAATEGEGA